MRLMFKISHDTFMQIKSVRNRVKEMQIMLLIYTSFYACIGNRVNAMEQRTGRGNIAIRMRKLLF